MVLVNVGPSAFFSASRGLRQRDPPSPLLSIIVMEALHKLIEQAKNLHMLKGITVGKRNRTIEISLIFRQKHPYFLPTGDAFSYSLEMHSSLFSGSLWTKNQLTQVWTCYFGCWWWWYGLPQCYTKLQKLKSAYQLPWCATGS